jgi:hypothetical protein
MERKQLIRVVLFVALVAGALGMRNYFAPGSVVRRQIFEAVASFKNENTLGVMSKISRSYTDDWGGSYEVLGAQAQSMMDAYDGLTMDVDIDSVEIGDNEARVELTFVIGGRTQVGRGNIFGTEADPCRATVRWIKEEPGWRLVETEALDIPQLREELQRRREP